MKMIMEGVINNNISNNKCQKFEPNQFNKAKCQTCFKSKDEHSAQALENTKNSRKIILCSYLFVAPNSFNFDNPLFRTRRWQRRLFVLYDDGELTYSIDENVDTIPQATINVSTCLEIKDAEQLTSHRFSIVVVAKDGTKTYIKGGAKEEIERFQSKLKSIMEGAKPAKVKRNFTIGHVPLMQDKKIEPAMSTTSMPERGSRSRVLSEISNRTVSYVVTGTQKNDSDFSSDAVDSVDTSRGDKGEYGSKFNSSVTTFRNIRKLKSKNLEKSGVAGNNLRKSLSLQTLDDGTTSDNDGEITSSNASVSDIKEFFEQNLSHSRSSSIRSLGPVNNNSNNNSNNNNNNTVEDSLNENNYQFYSPQNTSPLSSSISSSPGHRTIDLTLVSSPSVASYSRPPKTPGCTWPYFTPSSSTAPTSSDINEGRKIDTRLHLTESAPSSVSVYGQETNIQAYNLQLKLEETQNQLLNSQNINSILISEISKFVHPSQSSNKTGTVEISEAQEIVKNLNHFIQKLESEKVDFEAALRQRKLREEKVDNSALVSNLESSLKELKSRNDRLNTILYERDGLINKAKKDIEINAKTIKSKDLAHKSLEKNLLQANLALKASEVKIGVCEKENLGMKDKISEQSNLISDLQLVLKGEQSQKRNSWEKRPCCDDVTFERDSLLLKIDGLQKLVLSLEKDLSDEKFCRDSARKSFLKEVSDYKSRTEEDKLMIKNLQEDIEHLKVSCSETVVTINEKNTKISLLTSDLSKVEQELREILKRNESLRSVLGTSEKQVLSVTTGSESNTKKVLKLEDEIKKLASENEELNMKLEFNNAEKSCLSEEIEKLSKELSELEKEKTDFSEKLYKMETESKTAKLPSSPVKGDSDVEMELQQLRDYTGELVDEVEHYKSLIEEVKVDHQKKTLQLECHIGELTEQLKISAKEKNSVVDKKTLLENEHKQLSSKLKEIEKVVSQKDKTVQNLEKQVVELKSKLEKKLSEEAAEPQSVNVKTRNAEAAMSADQSKMVELEKNNSTLKQQVRKFEIDLEDVRSSSSLKIQELSKKLDLEQRRSSRFCDSLRKLSSENESEDASSHLVSMVRDLEESQEQMREKVEIILQLESKLKAMEEERRVAEAKVDSLQKTDEETLEDINTQVDVSEEKEKALSAACVDCKMYGGSEMLSGKIQQLEQQLKNIQDDHQHELAIQKAAHRREMVMSKEDCMRKLADAEANSLPINEDSIRKKYSKDVNKIKEMYNKGFHTLEKSQQQTIAELKRSHILELERLRLEKEQLLQEEADATQSALDAMKKAHEAEFERERQKFLDKLSHTYSLTDMKALQKKHQEDIKFIEVEIRQLSEQYSVKCLENAALNERLKQQILSLHDNRKRVQDLLARNEELTSHMKYEMEKLNRFLNNLSSDKFDVQSTLQSFKETFSHVKQVEVLQLSEQLKNAQMGLEDANEELREYRDKYHNLLEKLQLMQRSSNMASLDSSINDGEPFKHDDDGDSSLLQSNSSDWSLQDQTPLTTGPEPFNKGSSSRKLTWKFKGRNGKGSLNARLMLEKSKSVDSDHSVCSVVCSENETFSDAFVDPADTQVYRPNVKLPKIVDDLSDANEKYQFNDNCLQNRHLSDYDGNDDIIADDDASKMIDGDVNNNDNDKTDDDDDDFISRATGV